MNPKVQSELHPDADSLNAFAERVLPEAERAGIATHLAGCARCREVVYLAQAAADAEAAAPAAITKAAQPGWISGAFARWRVALIPAAALTAVGGVVLWVQLHPDPPHVDMAQMVAPPAAVSDGSHGAPAAPAPAATPSPEPSVAPSPYSAAGAKRSRRMASGLGKAATEEMPREEATLAPEADKRGYGAVHLDGHSASLAVQAPPAVAFSPSTETAFQSRSNPQYQSQAPMVPGGAIGALTARPPAPAPPNFGAVHGTAMAPSTAGPQPLDSAAASRIALTPEPANSFALLRLARRAKLPSGRNAVSSAAMLNRLLAVDSAGSVFLSQDAGKHWEAVPATWSGKALEVEAPPQHVYRLSTNMLSEPVEPAPTSTPVATDKEDNLKPSSATAAAKPEEPPAPAMLFRLVTDRRKTWVSADGKIWREQ